VKRPLRPNFVAAARYIKSFFYGKDFVWAAIGGLVMLCLGHHRREMFDIHIVYDVADYRRMKLKLEADRRATLPDGMNSLLPSKVLLRTGRFVKDPGCTEDLDVEINLVPSGEDLKRYTCFLALMVVRKPLNAPQ
ncbi:uncharacterized protein EI97DRAFT_383389, partial [Westerdykella ornata]